MFWLEKNILSQLPGDLSGFRDWRPPTTCQVYADGALIDDFSVERRFWVNLEDLPPIVGQAFIAAEDRRFYQHQGVDIPGIARAFWVNFQAGEIRQGGSTITQQLVKNLMVGSDRSYERKLKEAALAWRLENELTKHELLEMFLNYVYLGSGNYGVEAAARDYFGLNASSLGPGQAAMIAGLIPAPSRYSPRINPERARQRQGQVLEQMVKEGFITAEEAIEAAENTYIISEIPPPEPDMDASYITLVRRELRRLLPSEVIFSEGLQVHTAMDPRIQAVAEEAVRQALRDLDDRQGRRGVIGNVPADKRENWLQRGPTLPRDPRTGTVRDPRPGECFEVMVEAFSDPGALAAGPLSFSLREEDRAVKLRGGMTLAKEIAPGDLLRVCLQEDGQVMLDPRPWGEGAAVVIENATGRVLAVVGGYQVSLEGFVRATQATRQPGSSFKPYVYGAALMSGYHQTDRVLDAPISLPAGGGKSWRPQNYSGGYSGSLPMRSALARSLNTVAVRLVMELGTQRIIDLARSMGVSTPIRDDLTIALGSSEVTPMDQALGYAAIARMGVPTEAVLIDRVETSGGRTLAHAGEPLFIDNELRAILPGAQLPRAMPAGVAYELADMMRQVVEAGTARRARAEGMDRAGKTGTTNDFLDAWFVGFTPRYTVSVWIGSDGTTSLGDKETGGKTALPAWMTIINALPHEAGERFALPDEAVLVQDGRTWVGRARGDVKPGGSAPLPTFAP